MATMTKARKAEQQEAIAKLRKLLKPGDTVYTVLRHVSKSGMRRRIDLYLLKDGEPFFLTGYAAKAMDYRWDDRGGGIITDGCGMDMGFSLVYNLGRYLYPEGFAVTDDCDHCQDKPGYDGLGRQCKKCKGTGQMPARGRNGDMSGHDTDGGYALNHRWL